MTTTEISMFAGLKAILEVVAKTFQIVRDFRKGREREQNIIGLLKISFYMQDIMTEGRKLLASATPDPIALISKLSPASSRRLLADWEKVLRRQQMRLMALDELIRGQNALSVINPELQNKISTLIGSKGKDASKLYTVANILTFAGFLEEDGWQARVIKVMFNLMTDGSLDMEASQAELDDLEKALAGYRDSLDKLVGKDDIVGFTKRARAESKLGRENGDRLLYRY
jgi:paraquat-inducible protein B